MIDALYSVCYDMLSIPVRNMTVYNIFFPLDAIFVRYEVIFVFCCLKLHFSFSPFQFKKKHVSPLENCIVIFSAGHFLKWKTFFFYFYFISINTTEKKIIYLNTQKKVVKYSMKQHFKEEKLIFNSI